MTCSIAGIESEVSAVAQPGKNITLTIDERIQFVVERELRAAAVQYHAASGSAVVMNPQTGEILAMASYPAFDPNEPPQPGQPKSARFDYPVSVAFEPGSVFKIVTLTAGLETTNLRPDTLINCGTGSLIFMAALSMRPTRLWHALHGGRAGAFEQHWRDPSRH